MARLCQIIAVEKDVKNSAGRRFTDAHQQLQRSQQLAGITRTYRPHDEEGEQLPPESARVQVRAGDVLKDVAGALTRLFDVVATKDTTNCVARADVVLPGGEVLLADVPATYLLFLEKQLVDLRTFVSKLPTHDPSEVWSYNDSHGCWASEAARTIRSKKIPRNHVQSEATERHPAQVLVWQEDVPVGTWTTIKLSGALPASQVAEMLERVETLTRAVKHAREEANQATAVDRHVGEAVFGYLFG